MKYILLILLLFLSSNILMAQSPLCASRPTSFCCEYVSSVTINGKTYSGSNGFTSSSGGNPAGYYDYTTGLAVPTITAGQSISISYTAVTSGNYMEFFKLWIDFNGNGSLTDAGELIHSYNVSWTGTKTVTSSFIVPTTVYNGQVYMRFIMQYSGSPIICGTYSYGNTFDFKTTIVGAQINPNNPTPTETISGTVSIPLGLSVRPVVKLYSVISGVESLIQTVTVNSDGSYVLSPTQYNTTYKVVPSYSPSLTTTDLTTLLNEVKNVNVPPVLPAGLVLTTGPKMMSGDINRDGKVYLDDAYLLSTNLSGLIPFNTTFWFTTSDYSTISLINFNSITPSTYFMVNFTTSSITLNIKYIVLGDTDLSSSSQ
jgi:hypothetical protein